MKKWFYLCVLALGLQACIYPYEVQLDSSETEKVLVVDGTIVVGGESTVYLSYMIPFSSEGGLFSLPEGGTVRVEDETGRQYPGTPVRSNLPSDMYYNSDSYAGIIYSGRNVPYIVHTEESTPGHQYRVVAEVDGEVYVSAWQEATPVPEIQDVYFEADDEMVYVYVDLEKAAPEGSGYLNFTYDETWEFHVDYEPQWFVNTENWTYYEDPFYKNPYYWCFRSYSSARRQLIDYSQLEQGQVSHYLLTAFQRTNNRNHRRYSINVKAMSMTQESYQYERQTQQQTDVGGDLFSPDPGAIAGNLRCESNPEKPVMGMVMTCETTSKRSWLNNRYSLYRPMTVAWVFPENPKQMMELYYNADHRPIEKVMVENEEKVGWGPERCINCIIAGGTQVRPDFWENY